MNKKKVTEFNTNSDLLIGTRPLLEALEADKPIDKIFIQKGLNSPTYQELWPLIKASGVNYQHVPVEKLNRISAKNHQGIIAFASPVSFRKLGDVILDCFDKGKDPLVLILDRLTDVRNFGAICRTAECTGVDAIVIPVKGAAPVNFEALKTSAGAIHHLAICKEFNLKDAISFLQESGLKVCAATEKTQDLIYDHELSGPLALIMGSEEDGVSPEYLKMVDHKLKLPLVGKIGSLNVSVACGALLYEITRQNTIQNA